MQPSAKKILAVIALVALIAGLVTVGILIPNLGMALLIIVGLIAVVAVGFWIYDQLFS